MGDTDEANLWNSSIVDSSSVVFYSCSHVAEAFISIYQMSTPYYIVLETYSKVHVQFVQILNKSLRV